MPQGEKQLQIIPAVLFVPQFTPRGPWRPQSPTTATLLLDSPAHSLHKKFPALQERKTLVHSWDPPPGVPVPMYSRLMACSSCPSRLLAEQL